jgi:hypothetical protein
MTARWPKLGPLSGDSPGFGGKCATYARSSTVCKTFIRRFDSDPRLQSILRYISRIRVVARETSQRALLVVTAPFLARSRPIPGNLLESGRRGPSVGLRTQQLSIPALALLAEKRA